MTKKKIKMSLTLNNHFATDNSYTLKKILPSDVENIAAAMLDAYRNTIDYEGENIRDTINEVNKIINNKSFLHEASYLIEFNNQVVSAILINLYEEKPLITTLFTRKKYLNKGMATALIKNTIIKLTGLGYEQVILFVSENNKNAKAIYKKAGFTEL